MSEQLDRIEAKLDELLARFARPAPEDAIVWPTGHRPSFWSDDEVRSFVVSSHRRATVEAFRAQALQKFGAARAPSRSAIARVWKLLDRARRSA